MDRRRGYGSSGSSSAPGGLRGLLSRPYVLAGGIIVMLFLLTGLRMPEVDPSDALGELTRVDMHSHTTESDGDRTAEEQILLAKTMGMRSMWITDHDLIREPERTGELQRYGRELGVHVAFGVEITVDWNKKEHHLLGYFPDSVWTNPLSSAMLKLQKECAVVKSSRENRNTLLIAYLNGLLGSAQGAGYFESIEHQRAFRPLDLQTLSQWAQINANLMEPTSLGRPHFRKYLIEVLGIKDALIFGPRSGEGRGVLTSDGTIYWDDEAQGKDGIPVEALMHTASLGRRDILFKPLPIVDAIHSINAAGGRAVVAHPPTLGSDWYAKFGPHFAALAAEGLWGIEAFSSEISAEDHLRIHELAKDNNLQITGGSDNHGTLKVYAKLGDVHRDGAEVYEQLSFWAANGQYRSDSLSHGTDL
eukprot:m.116934 g.116934  ORF g.116934 m.116934 type:complete len:418 (-) comp9513_c0_seq1:376-1629(-)